MPKRDVAGKTLQALEEAQKPQDDLIHLSTGVVLRGKQAPPLLLMAVMGNFPRPKPPVIHNPKMGRDMENPDDPDYIERVKNWEREQGDAMVVALIATGTELVNKPKAMPGPADQEWLDEYSLLGLPMYPENKSWRYLRWVQFKAAISPEDMNCITEVVGRLSGIPEKAAKTAEEFPGSDQEGG